MPAKTTTTVTLRKELQAFSTTTRTVSFPDYFTTVQINARKNNNCGKNSKYFQPQPELSHFQTISPQSRSMLAKSTTTTMRKELQALSTTTRIVSVPDYFTTVQIPENITST